MNMKIEGGVVNPEEQPDLKIMTCIGSLEDYADELPYGLKMMLEGEAKDRFAFPTHEHIDNISFRANDSERLDEGLITGGDIQYVMSQVNTKDKFSSGFLTCLGLVVVGTDAETGENISVGLHTPLYDPTVDYGDRGMTSLLLNLEGQLALLRLRSKEGSISAVMVGGLIDETYGDFDKEKYTRTSDFLTDKVEGVVGVRPESIGGAKHLNVEKKASEEYADSYKGDNFYFDNAHRRLFLVRPEYLKE